MREDRPLFIAEAIDSETVESVKVSTQQAMDEDTYWTTFFSSRGVYERATWGGSCYVARGVRSAIEDIRRALGYE